MNGERLSARLNRARPACAFFFAPCWYTSAVHRVYPIDSPHLASFSLRLLSFSALVFPTLTNSCTWEERRSKKGNNNRKIKNLIRKDNTKKKKEPFPFSFFHGSLKLSEIGRRIARRQIPYRVFSLELKF